jgi:hypothetical protein
MNRMVFSGFLFHATLCGVLEPAPFGAHCGGVRADPASLHGRCHTPVMFLCVAKGGQPGLALRHRATHIHAAVFGED